MGKTKSLKRKRLALETLKNNGTAPEAVHGPPSKEPKIVQTVVPDEDLEITVETIQTLTNYPSLIKSKACKDLRVAIYDFRQACTIGLNTTEDANLTSRVTAALTDSKYTDALVLLAEMRIRGQSPKLGALCRWVRDLDVVSGLSMKVDGVSHAMEWSARDRERLKVLAMILRVAGPIDTSLEGPAFSSDPIRLLSVWDLREEARRSAAQQETSKDSQKHAKNITEQFRIIETTPGSQRKPPNLHPAILHSSRNDAISLSMDTPPAEIHHHPVVPRLSLIKGVLSMSECSSIIEAAQTIGFTPDAPIMSTREDASVLAHNFYWIIDESLAGKLWQRVKDHLPERVDGKLVRGLNRRFRVYRYVPGAEYRCHIDGAWPPSGINPVDDSYIYDSSPPDAKQSSLYTFLLYLNDDFDAGETTFFMPSVMEDVMNAYPVKPVAGAAAIFPHGEGEGALLPLLHEGSGVTRGAKYIVRTDVLYDVNRAG